MSIHVFRHKFEQMLTNSLVLVNFLLFVLCVSVLNALLKQPNVKRLG